MTLGFCRRLDRPAKPQARPLHRCRLAALALSLLSLAPAPSVAQAAEKAASPEICHRFLQPASDMADEERTYEIAMAIDWLDSRWPGWETFWYWRRGAETQIVTGDLGDPEFAEGLIDEAVSRFGGLDVLVANAGFPELNVFGELKRSELDACYRVITAGFFHLADRALPHLKQARDGRVIAVSTLNAHLFYATYPVYPASAAAKVRLAAAGAADLP